MLIALKHCKQVRPAPTCYYKAREVDRRFFLHIVYVVVVVVVVVVHTSGRDVRGDLTRARPPAPLPPRTLGGAGGQLLCVVCFVLVVVSVVSIVFVQVLPME